MAARRSFFVLNMLKWLLSHPNYHPPTRVGRRAPHWTCTGGGLVSGRGICSRMGGVKRPGEPPSADETGLVESTTQGTSKRLRHTPPTSPCTSAQPAGACPICRGLLVQKCARAALARLHRPHRDRSPPRTLLAPPAHLPPPVSRLTPRTSRIPPPPVLPLRRSPLYHLCHLPRPPATPALPPRATVAALFAPALSRVRQATSAAARGRRSRRACSASAAAAACTTSTASHTGCTSATSAPSTRASAAACRNTVWRMAPQIPSSASDRELRLRPLPGGPDGAATRGFGPAGVQRAGLSRRSFGPPACMHCPCMGRGQRACIALAASAPGRPGCLL